MLNQFEDNFQPISPISATKTECDLCNRNGECIISGGGDVSCECRDWFAGRNCQINLKLLLIVGCVSVGLMIFIACGVSCFCCKDRNGAGKNMMPCEFEFSARSKNRFCNSISSDIQ